MQPYLYTSWQLSQKVKRWLVQSFGDLHVTSRSSVTNKLQKLVEHDYCQVYVKVYRKSEKDKKKPKESWKVFKTTQ